MRSSLLSRWGGLALPILGSVALVAMGFGGSPDFGDPLPGLTADQRSRFENGKAEFMVAETIPDGLGPVFNDVACANCHAVPAVGGGSTRLETRYGTMTGGVFDPLSQFGGSLIHSQGIGVAGTCTYVGEQVPVQATIVTGRRSTPLFGLGLVDAVPDGTFRLIAAEQRFDPDITGVVSVVTDLSTGRDAVGKFGWKAQNPTLHQFTGDAYLNEMGITTPQFQHEICPQGNCAALSCNPNSAMNDTDEAVQADADFMTFLAPPPRGPINGITIAGELVFVAAGCANCHRPLLRTGPNPVAALNNVTFQPFSDFLLHDMGPLGDGITQNQATGRLMRTAPLWGLRKESTLLHDGRATTIEQAILAHDGQGRKARERFKGLPPALKGWLMTFLNSL